MADPIATLQDAVGATHFERWNYKPIESVEKYWTMRLLATRVAGQAFDPTLLDSVKTLAEKIALRENSNAMMRRGLFAFVEQGKINQLLIGTWQRNECSIEGYLDYRKPHVWRPMKHLVIWFSAAMLLAKETKVWTHCKEDPNTYYMMPQEVFS